MLALISPFLTRCRFPSYPHREGTVNLDPNCWIMTTPPHQITLNYSSSPCGSAAPSHTPRSQTYSPLAQGKTSRSARPGCKEYGCNTAPYMQNTVTAHFIKTELLPKSRSLYCYVVTESSNYIVDGFRGKQLKSHSSYKIHSKTTAGHFFFCQRSYCVLHFKSSMYVGGRWTQNDITCKH